MGQEIKLVKAEELSQLIDENRKLAREVFDISFNIETRLLGAVPQGCDEACPEIAGGLLADLIGTERLTSISLRGAREALKNIAKQVGAVNAADAPVRTNCPS